MAKKRVSDSVTIMSQLMMPSQSNSHGFIHGGTILKLTDEVAYICSSKHSGKRCVTASIDKVDFLSPVKVGEVLTFYSSVNYVGKSSMEVGVRVEAENLESGKKRHTNSCYVTMVALDKRGRPTKVPRIIAEGTDQKRRYREAEKRRAERARHKI